MNKTKQTKVSFNPNKIIKTLIVTDSLIWAGYFMNNAIASVHLVNRLGVEAVGAIATAYAIMLIVRSLPQLSIANYLDKNGSYEDEVWLALIGGVAMSVSFFLYIFVKRVSDLYLLQILFGIGAAMYLPAWRKVFAKYLDKGSEAKENALFDTIECFSAAILTLSAGFIVTLLGSFESIFYISGGAALVGAIILFPLLKHHSITSGKSL